jgi:hypothetical protein
VPTLFYRPQIAYFYVPALVGGHANQQVAKFALHALLGAAVHIQKEHRKQVYCIIDEFQEVLGANIGTVLKQAREYDVAMLLSNQLASDLDRGQVRLRGTVAGNTAVKWSFRTSDLEQQDDLIKASGEYIETLRTRSVSLGRGTRGWTETVTETHAEHHRPALGRNRILWSSFVDDLSLLHLSRGMGYTQFFRPFPLRTRFHISRELFERRGREPWPEAPPRVPLPVVMTQRIADRLPFKLKRFNDGK